MRLSVALVWESILDGERSGTILAARKSRRCPHDQSGTFDEKIWRGPGAGDLSFEMEEGQVYGFLGPNGAGKSTTMNIMTGCLSATAGGDWRAFAHDGCIAGCCAKSARWRENAGRGAAAGGCGWLHTSQTACVAGRSLRDCARGVLCVCGTQAGDLGAALE